MQTINTKSVSTKYELSSPPSYIGKYSSYYINLHQNFQKKSSKEINLFDIFFEKISENKLVKSWKLKCPHTKDQSPKIKIEFHCDDGYNNGNSIKGYIHFYIENDKIVVEFQRVTDGCIFFCNWVNEFINQFNEVFLFTLYYLK
jgi:hypothetical protein